MKTKIFIVCLILNHAFLKATEMWSFATDFATNGRQGAVAFVINSKAYVGTGTTLTQNQTKDFWEYNPFTGVWAQKADYGGGNRRGAVGFSIGNYGYVTTGFDGTSKKQDTWRFDPVNNNWTQKASFGGSARYFAVGFSLGAKGYVGTGLGTTATNDFYEYDPSKDSWIPKQSFPGQPRYYATGIAIDNSATPKGYIGTGLNSSTLYSDFYEYNPGSDTWTQRASFTATTSTGSGVGRYMASGFAIGDVLYMGTGHPGTGTYVKKDFWQYDPSTNVWSAKTDFGGTARRSCVAFAINGIGYMGLGWDSYTSYPTDIWKYYPDVDSWNNETRFPGDGRQGAVSFVINSKAYVGTGTTITQNQTKDFWEYDPINGGVWTQKADYGGGNRRGAVGFSIGNYGYVTTGFDGTSKKQDTWRFDPVNNNWTQKASFGGSARYFAVGFSLGAKGYVGTGLGTTATNDFYEYDPSKDSWIPKQSFPGQPRYYATGIAIDNSTTSKGYIGTGLNSSTLYSDFYEYDPGFDTWTQRANFTSTTSTGSGAGRYMASGFAIGDVLYMGTGHPGTGTYVKKDFWQYDPSTDVWSAKTDFGGTARRSCVAFAINGIGYMGLGWDSYTSYPTDIWSYVPSAQRMIISNIEKREKTSFKTEVFPNPISSAGTLKIRYSGEDKNGGEVVLSIYDLKGNFIKTIRCVHADYLNDTYILEFDLEEISPGVYMYNALAENKLLADGKIIIQ